MWWFVVVVVSSLILRWFEHRMILPYICFQRSYFYVPTLHFPYCILVHQTGAYYDYSRHARAWSWVLLPFFPPYWGWQCVRLFVLYMSCWVEYYLREGTIDNKVPRSWYT